MNFKKLILSTIILFSLSFAANASDVAAAEDTDTIINGVYIDEIPVGGMTRQEAEQAIERLVDELREKVVTVVVDGNEIQTTLGDIDYTYKPNQFIDEALTLGKTGNLIKRYKTLKDVEQGGVYYSLDFTYNESELLDFVTTEASEFNVEPVNATVKRENKKFVYTDHKVGRKVDIEQTKEIIHNAVSDEWDRKDILVEAIVMDDMPKYTRADVEKVDSLLGTFSTEYASSAEGRAANLANGAKLINNALLYPGDIFSGYEYLTPFTVDNGYYQAGAYQNGRVIDSIGGGACQVTTTLYNAALYSELEIVERAAHSMTISYADLSRDAAIAGTYKDLKFRNSREYPILIEAITVGRKITFNIWGHETRDTNNRKVEFVTVVTSETEPPADVITEDPTKPTTYRKVTQSAHRGYRSELYKVVYENGVEVSRQLVNKSSYAAAPRYVTIGTKPVEDKSTKEEPKKEPNTEGTDNTTVLDEAPTGDIPPVEPF